MVKSSAMRKVASHACVLTILMGALFPTAQSQVSDVQAQAVALKDLRSLQLLESPGSIPTWYVPSAKTRAVEYQQSMQPAVDWFKGELGLRIPLDLTVLDRKTYEQLNAVSWPLPYCLDQFGYVVFPDHIEDLLGPEPNAKTPGEYITYHESGHAFAARLGIRSGNQFVGELIANIFMTAYIHAKRPDLNWVMQGPDPSEHPRYTSFADLDYVYYQGVGPKNYAWYQWHLQRLAGYLTAGQSLPSVIDKLKVEFPASSLRQETLDEIIAHLDKIRPGVRGMLGNLAGPTTLSQIAPIPCSPLEHPSEEEYGILVIRNERREALKLTMPDGHNETIDAGTWQSFPLKSGESIHLGDGTCLVAGTEPGLATIGNNSGSK